MRPLYHLTAKKNWINDPNGFIYYKGEYHLFYQYFPYAPRWGTMHWYHVTSKDMVHFEDRDIALFPTQYFDANGCFSGSAIEIDGKMVIYYTAVRYTKPKPENIHSNVSGRDYEACQAMIVSKDGYEFDNFNGKKVIIDVGAHGDRTDTRDPKVWKMGDTYYMVLVSRYMDEDGKHQGQFLFYTSPNGFDWSFKKAYRKIKLGNMWECPDVFSTPEGQWMLIFSPENTESEGYPSQARIAPAAFDHETCDLNLLANPNYLDYGKDLYAPQTTTDKEGKRIYIGWLRMPVAIEGWIGAFCFPRYVQYKNNKIYTPIYKEADELFKNPSQQFDINKASKISLDLKDGNEIHLAGVKITFNNGTLSVDRSSVYKKGEKDSGKLVNSIDGLNECQADIYLDGCVLEIYINQGEYVLSNIIYSSINELTANCEYTLLTA